MPLGTLDRTPPPFFRQGPSALTKLVFFSALALFLMVADARFGFAPQLRAALATALLPVQQTLAVPVQAWHSALGYLQGLRQARADEGQAREALVRQAAQASRAEVLAQENARLRALLELRPALQVRQVAAEVLFEAADPYSRKLLVDRGGQHGVVPGSPAINEEGVLGQVTRVYPLSSEVTLLTDKDAAIPVLNTRTGQRSAAFGGGTPVGTLELRFMSGNADVQAGDELHTSGVDGVYPPGLPVARVVSVQRRSDAGFARIVLQPVAQADGVRHLLLLQPMAMQMPPRPEPAAQDAPARPGKGRR